MKQVVWQRLRTALFAGLAGAFGQTAQAQEVAAQETAWSVEGGIDSPSAFFYHGYRLVERGAMIQPYVTVSRPVWLSGGVMLEPYVGIWNNLTQDKGGRAPAHYNEVNPYVGVNLTVGRITATLDFNYYHSPSAYFEDASEAGFTVAVDHPFSPQVSLYQEIGGRRDTYAIVSMTPSWAVPRTGISVSFPASLGLSFNGYYADRGGANRTFGYASAGATFGYPLNKNLTLEAGADVLHLAAPTVQDYNGGERRATVARLGLLFSY